MKYRQRGYREDEYDDERKQKRREEREPDLGNREQIRTLRRAIDRSVTLVVRCSRCGNQVPRSQLEIKQNTTCSKCNTPLHSCRHCKNFDPQAHFECRASIEEPIIDKGSANACNQFKPAEAIDATGRRAELTQDPRSAFHKLFKS